MIETRVGQPRVGEDLEAYSRNMVGVFGPEWSKPWWEKRDERAASDNKEARDNLEGCVSVKERGSDVDNP